MCAVESSKQAKLGINFSRTSCAWNIHVYVTCVFSSQSNTTDCRTLLTPLVRFQVEMEANAVGDFVGGIGRCHAVNAGTATASFSGLQAATSCQKGTNTNTASLPARCAWHTPNPPRQMRWRWRKLISTIPQKKLYYNTSKSYIGFIFYKEYVGRWTDDLLQAHPARGE